jgi:hypothetical protein
MDNWLAQFIRETQTTYPNISQQPIHVMHHLLFVIGNEYSADVEEGDFVVPISYGKSMPFHTFYSENTTIEYLREYSNNLHCNDSIVEESATTRYEFLSSLYTNVGREFDPEELKDMVWDKEWAKFYGRYDNQVTLPNPTEFDPDDTLYNTAYWIKQIHNADIKLSRQDLSNYSKVCQFNMNTHIVLKKTAQAILSAFYLIAVKDNKTYMIELIANTLSNFITDKDTLNG